MPPDRGRATVRGEDGTMKETSMFKNIRPDAAAYAKRQGISPNHRRLARYANPNINRWTGKPHTNSREAARRQRQKDRDIRNQEARAADCFGCQIEGVARLSRRGRYIREVA